MGCGGETFAATDSSGSTTSGGGQGGTGGATTGTGGAGGAGASGGVGGSGSAGGTGGAPVCQPLSDPCAQCTYGACQERYCACYGDQDCVILIACEQACIVDNPDDAMAQQACQLAQCASAAGAKDHISETFLLGDCAAVSCGAECPGVTALTSCTTCLFTTCDSQMNECLTNADCVDILTCAQACAPGPNQLTCLSGCENQHPNNDPWGGVKSCLIASCYTDCTSP